jgi:hypothetical protein
MSRRTTKKSTRNLWFFVLVGLFLFLSAAALVLSYASVSLTGCTRPLPDKCTLVPPLSCSSFHMTPEGIELGIRSSAPISAAAITVEGCGFALLGDLGEKEVLVRFSCRTNDLGLRYKAAFNVSYVDALGEPALKPGNLQVRIPKSGWVD